MNGSEIRALENRLWKAADDLRANSKLVTRYLVQRRVVIISINKLFVRKKELAFQRDAD